MQPLIYDVLQTEGDFYLGNQERKHNGRPGGDNVTSKNGSRANTTEEDSSGVKMQRENGGLRPKSKRAKRGKRPKKHFKHLCLYCRTLRVDFITNSSKFKK